MSGGISALEGFDYQAMAALELVLDHFASHGSSARARPEGVDDLDLTHDDDGAVHSVFVQIKKPRQDVDGIRTPTLWTLSEVIDELLAPRIGQLRDKNTELVWLLGDALDDSARALLGDATDGAATAARRAAAERLAFSSLSSDSRPRWQNPLRAGTPIIVKPEDALEEWRRGFAARSRKAGLDAQQIAASMQETEEIHRNLDEVLSKVEVRAPYAEADVLRHRLLARLQCQFGLKEADVRDVVFRNLRGYIDDVARNRGATIEQTSLENEIFRIWPRRIPTTLPPRLPVPHIARRSWTEGLVRQRGGAVVGSSGAGKTTSATELFAHLRRAEPNTVVLYAEVLKDTAWRNVLEGVAIAVSRWGDSAPLALLPSLRDGHDEALLKVADTLEESSVPVALILDLVSGSASEGMARDLVRFAQRLPVSPKFRLWIFGQEDALAGLSNVERIARQMRLVSVEGLNFDEFRELGERHGHTDHRGLHRVYEVLNAGGLAGVLPRDADAVLRLPTIDAALDAARSDDVLLTADSERYERLPASAQDALGALACIPHPVRLDEAAAAFPMVSVKHGVRSGLRAGLLHSYGDERVGYHETVRRTVLEHVAPDQQLRHHLRLADVCAERGDRVMESYHAELGGLNERAKSAGRTAFFDRESADRVALRVSSRGWISPSEILQLLRRSSSAPYAWWQALRHALDDDSARELADWWREVVERPSDGGDVLWQAPRVLAVARPDLIAELLEIAARTGDVQEEHYGASALGYALRESDCDDAVLGRFERADATGRSALANTLRGMGTPRCLARWLRHICDTGFARREYSEVAMSDLHATAIMEELPELQAGELIARRNWGFGAATTFLWKNRARIGACVTRLLSDGELSSSQTCIAIRLLGLTGRHSELLAAASRICATEGPAQTVALEAPLLIDEDAWLEHLSSMVLDSSLTTPTRVDAFCVYAMCASSAENLLASVGREAPDVEPLCRLLAALSFVANPSLYSLDLLIEAIHSAPDERVRDLAAGGLVRAAYFADGDLAAVVAERLLPVLAIPSPVARASVLQALSMLRQRIALQQCIALALADLDTPVGYLAAVAACASRPTELDDVRVALTASPGRRSMLLAMAARFRAAELTGMAVAEASRVDSAWLVRRRALQTLEGFPAEPSLREVSERILGESSLLGAIDTVDGRISEALASLIRDEPTLVDLCRAGERAFVDDLLSYAAARQDLSALSAPVEKALSAIWRSLHDKLEMPAGEALAAVANEIHCLLLQGSALRLERAHGRTALIENVIARSDAPWLVFSALLERTTMNPREPADAASWLERIVNGPCGSDAHLAAVASNAVQHLVQAAAVPDRLNAREQPLMLSAEGIRKFADDTQQLPERVRLADLREGEVDSLFALLDRGHDSLIEVADTRDPALVVLTTDGVSRRPPSTRSTNRPSNRLRLRAMLVARFPRDVPQAWIEGPGAQRSLPAIIQALGDEGHPGRALAFLQRTSTDVLDSRGALNAIAPIADEALVKWIRRLACTGGPAQLAALASFAKGATDDAVLPLIATLMRRISGQLSETGAVVCSTPDDAPRLALVDLIRAKRFRDVPGAAEWLTNILKRTPYWLTRESIIEAMASFPSTWSVVESECFETFQYAHYAEPRFVKYDRLADQLFRFERAE